MSKDVINLSHGEKLIGLLDFSFNNRQGRTKAFKPAQHAPVAFVAFNVATDEMLMRAVFRTHNLFL